VGEGQEKRQRFLAPGQRTGAARDTGTAAHGYGAGGCVARLSGVGRRTRGRASWRRRCEEGEEGSRGTHGWGPRAIERAVGGMGERPTGPNGPNRLVGLGFRIFLFYLKI
jgi:hypothetical protein